MDRTTPNDQLLGLTVQIVSAHIAHNQIRAEALPALIQAVYASLSEAGREAAPVERPQPAVPIRKSVFPDHIVCLEDGRKLKMLKRHLRTTYNMTPDQYRERWGLPSDYPMVAPDYAERRSSLARQIGLGRRGVPDRAPVPVAAVPETRPRRGRPPKSARA